MASTDTSPVVTTSESEPDIYSTPIALGFPGISEAVQSCSSPAIIMTDADQNSIVVSYDKDVHDNQSVRGRCGLYNMGNTCFMNSGLQCLMSTIPLVTFLLEYIQSNPFSDQTLLGQFKRLFTKIWSGQFSIVHPKDFKQTLAMYHPQFQDFRQHDCQEFLALLLDTLHEQLNFQHLTAIQEMEAGSSGDKRPIKCEQNMNNMSSACQSNLTKENRNTDQPNKVATNHSHLTYDNMKENNEMCDEKNLGMSSNYDLCTDTSEQDLAMFTVNPISEESNHSTVSAHSSDSEQCSVIKNLRLRSSPVISQSCDVSSQKSNHNCAEDSNVSSTNDVDKLAMFKDREEDSFKRVQSLHDFRTEMHHSFSDENMQDVRMTKASSDNDLVRKVSLNEKSEFESFSSICSDSGQICTKNIVYSSISSEMSTDIHRQGLSKQTMMDMPCSSSSEPVLLNNAIPTSNVPSLEDLYAKETKTLNTNMLATEYMDETVTTDSDKFTKHDNTMTRPEAIEEVDILNNVMEVTSKTDGYDQKKVANKDVNIRADKKSRSPKGANGSNGNANSPKEDCFVVNSVKRMKFEGTEKNLQMQEISKINKQKLMFGKSKPDKTENLHRVAHASVGSMSVDSDADADSDTMFDRDVDMDMSDIDDDDNTDRELRSRAEGTSYTSSEVLAAEEAWQKYLIKNDSMVVDTFQGQFKSTVICSQCNQVSVTFEPFMYLSVPVPHAMERQLCITYISPSSEPTQYLLVMHKQDKVQKVKQELCNLIGREGCDIIMTEVLNWHISRILDDNTMLRYINDSTRKIYAFEIDPTTAGDVNDQTTSPPVAQNLTSTTQDVFSQMGSFNVGSSTLDSQETFGSHSPNYSPLLTEAGSQESQHTYTPLTCDPSNDELIGTGMWDWAQTPASEKRCGSLETETEENWLMADSTTSAIDVNGTENSSKDVTNDKGDNAVSSTSAMTTDQWKSCAICLEELTDNELMVHTSCGGTFCPNCLEMSLQHNRDSCYCCPVCSTPADMTEDFVPLANAANHKPKTRIVTIPISYRCETETSGAHNPFLFSHPRLLNLPSNLTGEHIYGCMERLKPFHCDFRIVLTDGQGLHCSRCLYMEHCSGCEIPRDGEVILRPGDHLTVSVTRITDAQVEDSQYVSDHRSMEKQRSDEPTTLTDCFTAFTESEELDEHNPWFCPTCKENQRAEKTMTVWQYPDTLIIQLKRFLFHELSSTKVDNKVVFPLDNLDLNNFISGPKTKNCQYNLYSLVCHFGGANSGHYTSYAKHPVDGRWYYYNDETVTQQMPGEDEYTSTYVLFYQRKGTDKALQIPDDLDLGCFLADDTSPVHSAPSVVFQPPEEEITLDVMHTVPSTSCHKVAPSSGDCDLVASSADFKLIGQSNGESKLIGQSNDKREEPSVDSSVAETEQVEADSTDHVSLDFYS